MNCFRYTKDINYYRKELAGLQAKNEELKKDPNACPHVLKKQVKNPHLFQIYLMFFSL